MAETPTAVASCGAQDSLGLVVEVIQKNLAINGPHIREFVRELGVRFGPLHLDIWRYLVGFQIVDDPQEVCPEKRLYHFFQREEPLKMIFHRELSEARLEELRNAHRVLAFATSAKAIREQLPYIPKGLAKSLAKLNREQLQQLLAVFCRYLQMGASLSEDLVFMSIMPQLESIFIRASETNLDDSDNMARIIKEIGEATSRFEGQGVAAPTN